MVRLNQYLLIYVWGNNPKGIVVGINLGEYHLRCQSTRGTLMSAKGQY